ncbi:MAG: hypothetical protein ACREIA_00100 [Opitutaceae bacterium]
MDYTITLPRAGGCELVFELLPTHPLSGYALRLAFARDGADPELLELPVEDGKPAWAQGVLDAGVVIDRIVVRVERVASIE